MPVVGLDITFTRVLADGKPWGAAGPYEELRGTLRFAADPNNPANARITDIALAQRGALGLVEFASDVSIILPIDRNKGSGRLLLDVVNRGDRVALPNFNRATRPVITASTPVDTPVDLGDGFLMKRGYTVVACGWQLDLPDHPAHIAMRRGHDARVPGRIYMQLQSPRDTNTLMLSDRGHKPYPAADIAEPAAVMAVRDMPDGEAHPIPRGSWRFGRITDDGAYAPDPRYVCSEQGFQKGRLYQLIYTTAWAPILGLSFAALRDCVSWFKYGSGAAAPPIAGVRHAYAYGRSQTGRWLRTYIHNDFNRDERGREALDGIIANVAGGLRGEFNQRYGQNSKDRSNMMAQLFPFAPVEQADPETNQSGSLHRRLDARASPLKVFYTNSSSEYHRGDASVVHTGPGGTADLPACPHARIYHFSGTEHYIDAWPPAQPGSPAQGEKCSQNLSSVADYSPLLRACLVNLDRWVAHGIEPPPSRHPRIADGTAVPPSALKPVFDRIPGANYPPRHPLPLRRDFGLLTSPEQATVLPPKAGKPYGSRVSAVDADGNEVAGIKLPEIAVPLAAHTGWTLRHPSTGGETQLLMFVGGTIPFPRDETVRNASGDPRPSIAQRYASKDAYLALVRDAAVRLVGERYLLEEDIPICLAQAARYWEAFAEGKRTQPTGQPQPLMH